MKITLIDTDGAAQALRRFAEERDWQQFHSPKNLAMALSGEVGELTEIFQWMTEADSHAAASSPKTAQAVRDELADVALYLIRLADVLGVDLNAAVANKLASNAAKYPIEAARGVSTKYDQLPKP
ncbi:nucleotide pyrophosphohydrolase [Hydrogenophaga sp.]